MGGTPHPVIVTIGDNRDCIRVLLYSEYTTITGWGVLLTYSYCAWRKLEPLHVPVPYILGVFRPFSKGFTACKFSFIHRGSSAVFGAGINTISCLSWVSGMQHAQNKIHNGIVVQTSSPELA